MDALTPPSPIEQYRETLRLSGITPDRPLYAVLMQAFSSMLKLDEGQQELREFLASTQAIPQAPLLSLAEEKRLIEDVKRELRSALYQQAAKAHRQIKWTTIGAALGFGFVLSGAAISGAFLWGWTEADARIIQTQSTLGAMPAGSAALWARFMRLNPGGFTCRADRDQATGKPVCIATLWSAPEPAPK